MTSVKNKTGAERAQERFLARLKEEEKRVGPVPDTASRQYSRYLARTAKGREYWQITTAKNVERVERERKAAEEALKVAKQQEAK